MALDATPAELKRRLGKLGMNSGPELRTLAAAATGHEVDAVAYTVRSRRGWLLLACSSGLHLARAPKLFGRTREVRMDWAALTGVRAGAAWVDVAFGETTLQLDTVGPHDEFVRLIESIRGRLPAAGDRVAVADVRELALRKLGRTFALGEEGTIDGLPDRLLPGERVQRLALAKLERSGLLMLTDRRLLLTSVGLRRGREHFWAVDRTDITRVSAQDDALEVRVGDEAHRIASVFPAERRDEFLAVLG